MLILIAGPSCSGKTTLARMVADRLKAPLLHLDRHWLRHVDRPIVDGHRSFERPDQYDGHALLEQTVEALSNHRHVVVEGFVLLTYPGFLDLAHRAIYLDIPHDVISARRTARSAAGSSLEDVPGGRSSKADDAWLAHGRREWFDHGERQRHLPGVEILTHDDLGDDPEMLHAIVTRICSERAYGDD